MSRRLTVSPILKGASIIALLAACPFVQAASVQTVFAAENALYGAGYGIGEADGWIDERLRAAIRQYQNDRPGLTATGELDSKTLSALGISDRGSQLLGGNAASSRAEAMKELGLVATVTPRSAPKAKAEQKLSETKPEPAPEPAPVVVATAAPEVQTAPMPEIASQSAAQETQQAAVTTEPTSEAIVMVSETRESTVSAPEESSITTEAVASEPAQASAEQSPVLSGTTDETPTGRDSGLSKMFDFLFGWMV